MYSCRIFLCSLILLSFCACDNGNIQSSDASADTSTSANSILLDENNDVLENTINSAMTALKNLDMETFNAQTNNRQITVTPWGKKNVEYTLFGELCEEQHSDSLDKEIVKNLSWKVSDITQNGDTAKVKLQITNLNLQGIFQRTETDSEMITEIRKISLNDTKTIELNLDVEKQNEKWILLVDNDFVNDISANIWIIDFDTADFMNESSSYSREWDDYFSAKAIGESLYTYEGVAQVSKEQKVEIISALNGDITAQITDLHDIADFLNQERMNNWVTVENIPPHAEPVLSVVRYALERKTINPQLKAQSQNLLYQAENTYYIEDKMTYPRASMPDCDLPRYYEIPTGVGEYLKQFID